mmetsp:Transcript_70515/g.188188  ORF Transcript_70515/g.188188 Transcript_70515/m.188188 type:complete len:217 (-) Transcript_70515:861-1511(-)
MKWKGKRPGIRSRRSLHQATRWDRRRRQGLHLRQAGLRADEAEAPRQAGGSALTEPPGPSGGEFAAVFVAWPCPLFPISVADFRIRLQRDPDPTPLLAVPRVLSWILACQGSAHPQPVARRPPIPHQPHLQYHDDLQHRSIRTARHLPRWRLLRLPQLRLRLRLRLHDRPQPPAGAAWLRLVTERFLENSGPGTASSAPGARPPVAASQSAALLRP